MTAGSVKRADPYNVRLFTGKDLIKAGLFLVNDLGF
jgi:hypothetical protein